ncbi:MAG: cytochrome c oxidase subunit II [Chloroflexota bacterium]|nr:MAG: cytochrome c oxidase subunit II [Chloroflexota bacterium]
MDTEVIGMVSTIDEALDVLKKLEPDLVIVDYDDDQVNREEFLARFVEGEGRLRVVLFSLKEGGDQAIVYDRRTMAASQIEEWLEGWSHGDEKPRKIPDKPDLEQSTPKRRDGMKHIIVAALLVIVLMAGSYFLLSNTQLLPEQASAQALPIDELFQFDFTAIAVLFSLIIGLMVYSIIVFRQRKGDDADGPHIEGNSRLEVLWTLAPLAFVLFLAYYGSAVLGETMAADPKPLRVDVIGSQWSWRFEYPDYGIISTEMVLPVDKQALLNISSTDVIHSFWVPEFRVKQDALPGDGFERELRVTPIEVGEYKVRCAELCGRSHYDMLAPVRVLSQSDFDAWLQSQTGPVSEDPVERGAVFAQQYGCLACHSIDGSELVGPTWLGVVGSTVMLEDGTSVVADRDYLYKSIREPGAQIVAGYQNPMPASVAMEMSDEQIDDVIAYIESLK